MTMMLSPMHEYLTHALANYFSCDHGFSEEEAIQTLRGHLNSSSTYADNLRNDVSRALEDRQFSWQSALHEANVIDIQSEDEARSYGKEILWDALFADRP